MSTGNINTLSFSMLNWVGNNDTISSIAGMRVGQVLDQLLLENAHHSEKLRISLVGIENMSPSFINGAFLFPFDLNGKDYVLSRLQFVQVHNRVVNQMREAFNDYEGLKRAFWTRFKLNSIYCAANFNIRTNHSFYQDLFRIAEEYNIPFYYNEQYNQTDKIYEETLSKIQYSGLVIALGNGLYHSQAIIQEIDYALQCNKSILLFWQRGGENPPDRWIKQRNLVNIVYYQQGFLQQAINDVNRHALKHLAQIPEPYLYRGEEQRPEGRQPLSGEKIALWSAAAILGVGILKLIYDELNKDK
jgi:hypothetical protein